MLAPTSVKDALQGTAPAPAIQVRGWVRTRRDSKDFSFIELNDGSCLRNLQIIAKNTLPNYAEVQHIITGASIAVRGALVVSQGKGQSWEVVADDIEIVGASDDTYPLQKKGHTPEFLREIAHLRPRSNLFGAVFRVRSRLAFALRRNQCAVHDNRSARDQMLHCVVVRQGILRNDLKIAQARAIVQLDEGEILRIAAGPHPSPHLNGRDRRLTFQGILD